MILFAPEYDEPTCCTYRLALTFSGRAAEALLRTDATRDNLHRLLHGTDHPLVAFGHGGIRHLPGQDSVKALTDGDATHLPRKSVFVFACHTGTELGGEMARYGHSWWGYTGLITAPPEEATESGIMRPVFDYLVSSFLELRHDPPAEQFFARLKGLCEEAAFAFDDLQSTGEDVGYETYNCLLHIWDRLRIWNSDAREPHHHPHLQSSIYILG